MSARCAMRPNSPSMAKREPAEARLDVPPIPHEHPEPATTLFGPVPALSCDKCSPAALSRASQGSRHLASCACCGRPCPASDHQVLPGQCPRRLPPTPPPVPGVPTGRGCPAHCDSSCTSAALRGNASGPASFLRWPPTPAPLVASAPPPLAPADALVAPPLLAACGRTGRTAAARPAGLAGSPATRRSAQNCRAAAARACGRAGSHHRLAPADGASRAAACACGPGGSASARACRPASVRILGCWAWAGRPSRRLRTGRRSTHVRLLEPFRTCYFDIRDRAQRV